MKSKDCLGITLAIILFISLYLPIFAVNKHHDCLYDDCMKIFVDGKLGICVEKTIDNMCGVIGVGMWFSIVGGLMVISKNRNAISPYIITLLLIVFAVILAFLDPSKWLFVASLLPSFIFMVVIVVMDDKIIGKEVNGRKR